MITQKQLKQSLSYNPITGEFTWKQHRLNARIGLPAGTKRTLNKKRRITLMGKTYDASKLSVLYMTGSMPKFVHYKNKKSSDTRYCNIMPSDTRMAALENNERANKNKIMAAIDGEHLFTKKEIAHKMGVNPHMIRGIIDELQMSGYLHQPKLGSSRLVVTAKAHAKLLSRGDFEKEDLTRINKMLYFFNIVCPGHHCSTSP